MSHVIPTTIPAVNIGILTLSCWQAHIDAPLDHKMQEKFLRVFSRKKVHLMVWKILYPHKYVRPSKVAICLFLFGMSYLCEGSFSAISFPLGKYCQVYVLNLKCCMVWKRFLFQWWHWKNFWNQCYKASGFGGLEVSVLAFGTRVRGFKPGRSRRIFRAKKSSARLPSEGK